MTSGRSCTVIRGLFVGQQWVITKGLTWDCPIMCCSLMLWREDQPTIRTHRLTKREIVTLQNERLAHSERFNLPSVTQEHATTAATTNNSNLRSSAMMRRISLSRALQAPGLYKVRRPATFDYPHESIPATSHVTQMTHICTTYYCS
jgi:hypothetical protein